MEHRQDYIKWERRNLPESTKIKETINRPVLVQSPSYKHKDSRSTAQTPLPAITKGSTSSPRYRHWSHTRHKVVEDTKNSSGPAPAPDSFQILKFQIKAKRNCVLEYKRQIKNLIEQNIKLKKEIQKRDQDTHGDVGGLLHKYHKLAGAMGTITREQAKQKVTIDEKYNNVKASTEELLLNLKQNLDDVDASVTEQQTNLKTLINYKNKEYPEKLQKIKALSKELELVRHLQALDLSEVKRVISVEIGKYKRSIAEEETLLLEDVRMDIFNSMERGVQEKALENIRFRKEIKFHLTEKKKLEEECGELEMEIRRFIIEEQPVMRDKIFPGVFIDEEICSPDTEIVLRIPKKEFIPI